MLIINLPLLPHEKVNVRESLTAGAGTILPLLQTIYPEIIFLFYPIFYTGAGNNNLPYLLF